MSDNIVPDSPAAVQATLLTVRDWLRYATSRFNAARLSYGHGTSNALDEAAFLILHTLSLPIDQLDPWLDARLTPEERGWVHAIIEARISTRKPAPYLTGVAYIQGHRFAVDERVIVPRSYIGELLATGQLDAHLEQEPARVLDLCTGSGCLAILAAHAYREARIDAVDISEDALDVARRNLADHDLTGRVSLHRGDLFAPLKGRRYDLIIANPPYVAEAELAAFPAEYATEPRLAHDGGRDGLDIARRILMQAAGYLTKAGVLVMEIGTGRERLEASMGPQFAPLWLDTETSEGEVLVIAAQNLPRG